jgi:hypothetical protein
MADLTPEQKEEDKKTEDWMTKKWRPMMAMMYMSVCAFDFIVAPILWAVVQFWETSAANDAFRQWSPLTLQGAGLFHMAMGAVLGITAWSRGQEKLAGVADVKSALPSLGSTPAPAFGSVPLGGNSVSTAPSFSAPAPSVGFGGKLAPPPAPQPEL